MVSRFFGKQSKKSSSPSNPIPPISAEDEEGFTVVGHATGGGGGGSGKKRPSSTSSAYPSLPGVGASGGDSRNLPYQLPARSQGGGGTSGAATGAAGGGYSSSTLASQSSLSSSHALDGVPFVLSGPCRGGGSSSADRRDLDLYLQRTESYLEGVQEMIRKASARDFALEKSVVRSDITATMRRMHVDPFAK